MKHYYTLLTLFFCFSTSSLSATSNIAVEAEINFSNAAGAMGVFSFNGEINGRNSYAGNITNSALTIMISWSGTQWEIIAEQTGAVLFSSNYNTSPNPPDLATGNWQNFIGVLSQLDGCGTQEVVLDLPATFDPICENAGYITGLGGGTPIGGVYSGPGVTDDGNGMTFSFNPAVVGAGVQTISYGDASNSTTSSIEVLAEPYVTFTSTLTEVCDNAGVQTNLGGGFPEGGVYCGPGISDDGNGMTFSFDPAAAGLFNHTVIYTLISSNVDQQQTCSPNSTASLSIFGPFAQSFIPTSTQICGAGFFISPSSDSGNLTIALWDALPDTPGANMLANSMIAVTPDSYADVSWTAIDVSLNNTYYLVLTSNNNIKIGVADFTPYTNGQAYGSANISYEPIPSKDYTFRTFNCSDASCTSKALATIEVFSTPTTTFTSTLTEVCENAGVQAGLSGGLLEGGVYSGPGITDDGNGITFSFDPEAAGVGTQTVSYTVTGAELGSIDQKQATANLESPINSEVSGVQSFTPSSTQICGAGFFILPNSESGNLNIALWDTLPDVAGANMLTSSMVAVTPDSYADVSWTAIDVSTDDTYYLVLTSDDDIFIGFTSFNSYDEGMLFWSNNGPYEPQYVLDFAFRTFGCSPEFCASEAIANIEVLAVPDVTFNPIGPFSTNDEIQPLTQGIPAGGTYSGDGVVDNGDGTYSFDPSIGGGSYSITYTVTNDNGCIGYAIADIVVEEVLIGDECNIAIGIDSLFGQPVNEPQLSSIWDNSTYTVVDSDPTNGTDCFFDGRTAPIWFTFTGDGNRYNIKTDTSGTDHPINRGDTQFAIYTGECNNLTPLVCSEDENYGAEILNANTDIDTEEGIVYNILVDGTESILGNGLGEYRIQVTQLMVVNTTKITSIDFRLSPNPTNGLINIEGITPDQIRINDTFGRLLIQSTKNTNVIDLSNLPSGVYIIQIEADDQWTTRKIIKN